MSPALVLPSMPPLMVRVAPPRALTLLRLRVPPKLSVTPLLNVLAPLSVRVPPTEVVPVTVMPTLVVVLADPLSVRLLKLVKTVEGRVLVPVRTTVPVPGVQVLVAAAPTARLPAISVPPAVMVSVPLPTVPPSVKLPAVRVEPLVKVTGPAAAPSVVLPRSMAPETVSEGLPPENVSAPGLAQGPEAPSCTLPQASVAVTVTVNERSMMTVLLVTGLTAEPKV